MNGWIEWAATRDGIGTPEKLALVLLASKVNTAGVGLRHDGELQRMLGCKRRSLQRHLKTLRDAELLAERGPWYVLLAIESPPMDRTHLSDDLAGQDLAELPDPPAVLVDEAFPKAITLERAASLTDELSEEVVSRLAAELHAFEQRIGQAPAGDEHQRALAVHLWRDHDEGLGSCGQTDRQGKGMNWRRWWWDRYHVPLEQYLEGLGLLDELDAAEPEPPPPDPILDDPLYKLMIESGIEPEKAYRIVARNSNLGELDRDRAPDPPPAGMGPSDSPDTGAGSLPWLWRVLHGGTPPAGEIPGWIWQDWRYLVQEENKHTVPGEAKAFDLLYPAIEASAEAWPGSAEDFFRACFDGDVMPPWDRPKPPPPGEDAALEADINGMLRDLAAVNDPRCEVQPRTVEKREDGTMLAETMTAYHRRVQAKWRQMQQLKQMGVI